MLRIENGFDEFVSEAKMLFPSARDFSANWGHTRDEDNCTYHDTPEGVVRVQWTTPPTDAQIADIGARLIDAVKPLTQEQAKAKKINAFAVSDELAAKSARGFARVVHTSVSNVITKHNALVAILASGRFPTQQEAASLTIPIRDFATLMTNVKQMAINEADPAK